MDEERIIHSSLSVAFFLSVPTFGLQRVVVSTSAISSIAASLKSNILHFFFFLTVPARASGAIAAAAGVCLRGAHWP